MKNVILSCILLLAFILRIYSIATNPPSVYGDEIAFGWNAYSVLKTGADEFGERYPLQFRSFDDYKSPVPVYLLIPFISVLGLNAFSLRLPVIIIAVLTIYVTYLFGKHFFGHKIGLLSAFLLTISPWHTHLSRGYFEATLALFPFVWGIYLFVVARNRLHYVLASSFLFSLSLYTYFTPRILVPIMVIFLLFYCQFFAGGMRRKNVIVFLLTLFLLLSPLIKASIFDKGLSRFYKLTSIANKQITELVIQEKNISPLSDPWSKLLHNKNVVWARQVKNNYLEHFSSHFWFIYGDDSLRYFSGNMGMFYLIELPFFVLGVYTVSLRRRSASILLLGWLILAPIPSALVGRSFALRSLAMLPAPFFFTAHGILSLYTLFRRKAAVSRLLIIVLVCGFFFSLFRQLIAYHKEYPIYAATWWGWENKAAIDYAKKKEDNYDYIFISDFYTGSALAYAFYSSFDPAAYRDGINHPVRIADRTFIKLGKYYFGSLDLDKNRIHTGIVPPKSLYIGRTGESEGQEAINAPVDRRPLFHIHWFL